MITVRTACTLQPNALDINVNQQIERIEEIVSESDGNAFFEKTYITDGMKTLLSKGYARLSGKSEDSVFHLKQAMGGGKTHLMVGFGFLAKNPTLRSSKTPDILYHNSFTSTKVASFNGRNNPVYYFWGEISRQLGKENLFKQYWENGPKAPDENAWLGLFEGTEPILILMDEMPPYFHYYNTQSLGQGTIADVITRAFSNMLSAAQKKNNVCIVVSDLEAAYETGGKLIMQALKDARNELGRAEVSITPVNLESNEIYEILRKRLFINLPDKTEIQDIAEAYGKLLSEAATAKTIERSAESIASEIEETYPFHPRFKNLVALFKANERFKQTRGLMELVSRLLKSVWNRPNHDVFLIGAQHFDLSIPDVREKLSEISEMRDVIARDLWDSTSSAHAQVIDENIKKDHCKEVGCLLLTASLSTAVNSVKGLTEAEMLECLLSPLTKPSEFKNAFHELQKTSWYLHQTDEGRNYFDRQENLTKKLEGYAEKAPQNRLDEMIRWRLEEMYKPTTKEAYDKIIVLPQMQEAEAACRHNRPLLIVSPDGKTPPDVIHKFFENLVEKNNVLFLTGEKSQIASVEKSARHLYATQKADSEVPGTHPQRKELDDKKQQYEKDFHATILSVFDKLLFPGTEAGKPILRGKALDNTYDTSSTYNGENQIRKTLIHDPIKLYTEITSNFDALKARAESVLFGNQDEVRTTDLKDKMKQKTEMPWLPTSTGGGKSGLDVLIDLACNNGLWENLGNGYITKKPRPKKTSLQIVVLSEPDDTGKVRLNVETQNVPENKARIHFQEDGVVSESSPVLTENQFSTKALKIQFLVVDITGKSITGEPILWSNTLKIRGKLDDVSRKVELFVVPSGKIRYTTDGSEPRNGLDYTSPIQINDEETKIYAFAETEGIETKQILSFPKKGNKKVVIQSDKPAVMNSPSPKKLDNPSKVHEGLSKAKEKTIEFSNVNLTMGSGSKMINVSFGDIKIKSDIIQNFINTHSAFLEPNPPINLSFRKAYFPTGFDMEQFGKDLGLEWNEGEVSQD